VAFNDPIWRADRERAIAMFHNDPRFEASLLDREEPPFYRYREYGHYEYEIVGRDGSHFSSHAVGPDGDYGLDLFMHGKGGGYLCEEGLKDIDAVIDELNERRWRLEALAEEIKGRAA
jgi:hypothetical protein